jgi:cytochrome b561
VTDVAHAVGYLLPGLGMGVLASALWRAGRRAAADPVAPRWARWYARVTITVLYLMGAGLIAIGVALAALVLRR